MSLIEVQHPIGYNLHPEVFRPVPVPVHFELPAKPTIKNDKIVKAQQFAQIVGAIGQLPSVMQEQWQKGSNLGLQQNLRQRYMAALSSGKPEQLAGFGVGPNGVTYDPSAAYKAQLEAPLRQAKLAEAQAGVIKANSEAELTRARAKAMQNPWAGMQPNDQAGAQESQDVVSPPVPADQGADGTAAPSPQSDATQPDPSQQVASTDDSAQPDAQDPSQPQLANFSSGDTSVDPGTAGQINDAAAKVTGALSALNATANLGDPIAQQALQTFTASTNSGQPAPGSFVNQATGNPEFFASDTGAPVKQAQAVSSPANDALGVQGGQLGGFGQDAPAWAQETPPDATQMASDGADTGAAQGAVATSPAPTDPTQAQPTAQPQVPQAQQQAPAIHAQTGQVKNGAYYNGNNTASIYSNGILAKILVRKPDGTGVMEIDPPKRVPGFPSAQEAIDGIKAQGLTPTGKVTQTPEGKWIAEGALTPKLDSATQKEISQANGQGAGIAVAGKTQDDLQAELAQWHQKAGTLNEQQLNQISRMAPTFDSLPIVRNAQGFIDGYNNAKYAATDPSMVGTGVGDKTLIEETQRLLNPGGVVSPQTMHMFGASVGLMEKMTPDYIASHLGRGAILTDAERKQLLSISDKAMQSKIAEMDSTASRFTGLAKQAGISKEKSGAFFNNPYRDSYEAPPAQSAPPATANNPATVNSKADFMALPKGSFFRDGSGKLKQK